MVGHEWYLPYGKFKWLKNVNGFAANSISEKSSIGYFIEYHDELHTLQNDYPLAPEKIAISYETKIGDVKKYFQIWVTKLIMCFITEIFSCICLYE